MMWIETLFNNIVFQTVIAGVLIFTLQQLIKDFVLSPIKEFKSVIGKIDNRLKFYANVITSFIPTEEVSKILRDLSCDLESSYKQIPFKKIFRIIKAIPLREEISEAATGLIFLSNINHSSPSNTKIKISEELEKIRKILGIEQL